MASADDYGVVLCANTNTTTAPPTGTAIVPTHNFLGNVMGFASKALVIATAATGATTPVALRPLWSVGAETVNQAALPQIGEIDLGGDYVLAPGATLSFQFINPAGSTACGDIMIGISWAEIPLA